VGTYRESGQVAVRSLGNELRRSVAASEDNCQKGKPVQDVFLFVIHEHLFQSSVMLIV